MKLLISVLLTTILIGCASVEAPEYVNTRLNTDFKILIYNDLSADYVERPTFGSITEYPNKEFTKRLGFQADGFGQEYVQYLGYIDKKISLRVYEKTADSFIKAIDKYLEWEKQAVENQHQFEKLITVTPRDYVSADFEESYKLGFFSGNQHTHYFYFTSCMHNNILKEKCHDTGYLDKKNALRFKEVVTNFKNGNIEAKNISDEYN